MTLTMSPTRNHQLLLSFQKIKKKLYWFLLFSIFFYLYSDRIFNKLFCILIIVTLYSKERALKSNVSINTGSGTE